MSIFHIKSDTWYSVLCKQIHTHHYYPSVQREFWTFFVVVNSSTSGCIFLFFFVKQNLHGCLITIPNISKMLYVFWKISKCLIDHRENYTSGLKATCNRLKNKINKFSVINIYFVLILDWYAIFHFPKGMFHVRCRRLKT